jgi:hypothetical protein
MGFEPPQAPPSPGWGDDSGQDRPAYSAGPSPVPQGRTPGKATASLVLGIVGLLICPLVCSVLALILGKQAKDEIARDPALGGAGVAQAGFVLGIVGLAVMGLLVLLIAAGAVSV